MDKDEFADLYDTIYDEGYEAGKQSVYDDREYVPNDCGYCPDCERGDCSNCENGYCPDCDERCPGPNDCDNVEEARIEGWNEALAHVAKEMGLGDFLDKFCKGE